MRWIEVTRAEHRVPRWVRTSKVFFFKISAPNVNFETLLFHSVEVHSLVPKLLVPNIDCPRRDEFAW